ncbi:MAG: hypothetical protein OD815_001585 [Candidatus Alkanophagales archaeon MCA70_species_2]|nr:hypothetical protein [Candidatus Alkanophaga liquidiphilum]
MWTRPKIKTKVFFYIGNMNERSQIKSPLDRLFEKREGGDVKG